MSTDKEKIARKRDDAQWIMSTEQGRRFAWELLSYCGVYQDGGGPHEEVYKQLGKRNVGLHLLGIISDASEDRLFEMMREAKNRNIEEQLHDTTSRSISTVDGLIDTASGLPSYSSGGPVF